MDRRQFLSFSTVAVCGPLRAAGRLDIRAIDRDRVLKAAEKYLRETPVTVTATASSRSTGGKHDYFSEGDYWWPDPQNPGGPYIQRDGMSNPDNFGGHRAALIRLGVHVPALTAAWLMTKQRRFSDHAVAHLRAWFLQEETRMNPNLQYAQAIHGRFTGRGTGIIDTLHLVEVARAMSTLEATGALAAADRDGLRKWFSDYLDWMTTSENGIQERDAKNNHGTCWVEQAAEFARFTGDAKLTEYCRDRFKTVLAPNQIASDGSFPEELRRTKPYGYSLFNLDAMATVCQTLSTPDDNLFAFRTPNGAGFFKAMEYMAPFIADKKTWPRAPDVMYHDGWPVRHPALLFSGLALGKPDYIALWRRLDPDPTVDEIIRNYPIRQPILWLSSAALN
jgi:hypothetical protein